MHPLPASHRVIPNFNFNQHPYKMSLIFVTFTEMWKGCAIIIAVKSDSYIIARYCPFGSNKCKYVPFECFKCKTDWYILSALPISYKMTIGFDSLSVNPSVLSFSQPHRMIGLRIEESSKYFIFQIFSKIVGNVYALLKWDKNNGCFK